MLQYYIDTKEKLQTISMLLQRKSNNREGFEPDLKHIVTKRKKS